MSSTRTPLFERGRPIRLTAAQRRELATKAYLTPDETARYLEIGLSSAYTRIANGSIPSVRLGKRLIRVNREALDAMQTSEHTAIE